MKHGLFRAAALSAPLALLSACAQPVPRATTTFEACPTVPARPAVLPADPLPPVSTQKLTLAPGHWEWNGDTYVWERPHWVPRLSDYQPLWLDGSWRHNGAACVWVPGHFIR